MNHQPDQPPVYMCVDEASAVLGRHHDGPRVDTTQLTAQLKQFIRGGMSTTDHTGPDKRHFLLNVRGTAQRQFLEADRAAGSGSCATLPAGDLAGPSRINRADRDLYEPDLLAHLAKVADGDQVWIIGDDLGDLLLLLDSPPVTIGIVAGSLHELIALAAEEAAARREHAADLDAHAASLSGRAGADTEPVDGVPAPMPLPTHQVHVIFRADLLRDATSDDTARIAKIVDPPCGIVLRPLLPRREPSAAARQATTDWWKVTNKAGDELARVHGETIEQAKINAGQYPLVSASERVEGGAYYRRLFADELRPEQTGDNAPDQQRN